MIVVEDVIVKLILVLSIFGLILFFINKALRKWLNVEKKSFFSYGHVNDKHKKIDWTIRILTVVFLSIVFLTNVIRDPLEPIWFMQTHILLFFFIITIETVRVIMEKRYAENRNDYIFSAIQLAVISILLLLLITTNFFGLVG